VSVHFVDIGVIIDHKLSFHNIFTFSVHSREHVGQFKV